MQVSIRLPIAIGVAFVALTGLSACSGTPSTTQYQSVAQVRPEQTRTRPAEIYNWFQTTQSLPPSYPMPSDFNAEFAGNVVSEICGPSNPPCSDQALYGPYDPFCPPSHGPSNPCYPTVTYSPTTGLTTVTYAGSMLFQNIPSQPGKYHFGLLAGFSGDQSGGDRLYGCGAWSFNTFPNAARPFVNINWNPSTITSSSWTYAEVYVSVGLAKGGPTVAGFWTEVAYVPGTSPQPTLTFTNNGSQTLYVTSSGIVPNQAVPTNPACITNPGCAQDMAILAKLSFAGSPPPGSGGSPFVPLNNPPAAVLQPQSPSCTKV